MNNIELIKEHTLALALIGYYDMSNKQPLRYTAFSKTDLWLYYLDLHKELFNRNLSEEETDYAIMNITWNGDEKLLVEYVCEIGMEMLHEINSMSFLQRIES